MCFSKEDILRKDSLSRPISLENIDNSLWSDKCDYWLAKDCDNLNLLNYNLIVLQLNVRSVLSKLTELKILLTELEKKNSPVDVILLCKTFLSSQTEKLVKVPNFRLYATSRKNQKGGGTAILV